MRTLLYIIRGIFILVCAGAGLAAARIIAKENPDSFLADPFMMVIFAMLLAFAAIVVDVVMGKRTPAMLGAIFVGVIVAAVLTVFAAYAVSVLFPDVTADYYGRGATMLAWVILTYLSVTVILQTKDNFRFVIPYVEFHRQTRGERPLILDTSVVIDGRIADVVESGIILDPIVVPSFVVSELQAVADSSIRTRRVRGRRGLDILSRLRSDDSVEVKILETDDSDEPVDQRLVKLARSIDGRILTTDFNLKKVAEVHGVEVINLNDISNALRPVVIPGESLRVGIIKAGEEADQGVGFLDDGTMVVVEGGKSRIGKSVSITVTSVLQTNAGRMIFGKPEA